MEINFPQDDGQPRFPQFHMGPWMVPIMLFLFGLTAVGTLFYQVDQDEAGVVQRFGKYVRTTQPGLHMKLPFGVETVKNIKVTHVFKEEFGFRTVQSGVRTIYAGRDPVDQGTTRVRQQLRGGGDPFLEESMMLTGDLNVAIVEWIVQFTVKDPVAYAFRIREERETIRNMSEAVMRLVIGDHTINQILTSGREKIQREASKMLQEVLDSYGAGVDIRNIILQDVTPPNEVKPSFNEVNEARQEKEQLINQAWEEYNRVIPKAKGQAEQVLRAAEGYALERTNRAEGDAKRFLLTWEEYKKAPVVTRQRLYLETMEQVMPTLQDKLILDDSKNGILPLLQLNKEKGAES